jgi:hypothetical protein
MNGEKVVALPGHFVPVAKGTIDPEIVAALAKAYEAATSGRLRAVGLAAVYDDGSPDGFWEQTSRYIPGSAWTLSIAINGLKWAFDNWLYDRK